MSVDLETNGCQEIDIGFDLEELREQEPGFRKNSQWLQYACEEDAFNSLEDFLNGTLQEEPLTVKSRSRHSAGLLSIMTEPAERKSMSLCGINCGDGRRN